MILQHFTQKQSNSVCQQLMGILACSIVTSSPLHTVPHAAEENWLASDGVICADSHAGVDRRDVSAPRVPSESDAGGLYKDVFLQITRWGNIQKLPTAWQAGCPVWVIAELKRTSFHLNIPPALCASLITLKHPSRKVRDTLIS